MPIRILVTGGSFDKEYNEITESLGFRKTHVPDMLVLGRCRIPFEVETLMLVDSLEIDEPKRALICKRVAEAPEKRIVITHGTSTMELTAQYINERVKDKTVVLTGAMVPYKVGSSDGLFNLGSALSFVQTLPNGVYVAMNGRIFTADNVRKDKEAGIFVEKKPQK